MPAAISSSGPGPNSLSSLLESLQYALHNDLSSAADLLSTAKRQLLHANALIPAAAVPSQTLHTARSILETGALISIHLKDSAGFLRYWSQLQPFYEHHGSDYEASPDRSKITGLYLLLLLSQGDYAAFHTVLEGLVAAETEEATVDAFGRSAVAGGGSVVERDPYIRYPVELERSLMEGSYDQVWKGTMGEAIPTEEFALFSQDFIHTIRREIASCAQSSYPSLPVSSAKNLFFLDSDAAVVDFARHNGWSVDADGNICFPHVVRDGDDDADDDADDPDPDHHHPATAGGKANGRKTDLTADWSGPGSTPRRPGRQKETIQNMVGYARELEMIV